MNKMSKEQKHQQCVREIKGTLIVTGVCCAWHIITAFALNGSGLYFIGMPAWFSVSVFGVIILALAGVWYLVKHVFVDFDYDDESEYQNSAAAGILKVNTTEILGSAEVFSEKKGGEA